MSIHEQAYHAVMRYMNIVFITGNGRMNTKPEAYEHIAKQARENLQKVHDLAYRAELQEPIESIIDMIENNSGDMDDIQGELDRLRMAEQQLNEERAVEINGRGR